MLLISALRILEPQELAASAGLPPALAWSRAEPGDAVRVFTEQPEARPKIIHDWGGIRAVRIHSRAEELPEGHLLNHAVTLNLGSEATSESNFEGHGWQTLRTPHHGVSVFPALLPYTWREHAPRELLVVELTREFLTAALGPAYENAELRPVVGVQDPFAQHVLLALAAEVHAGGIGGQLRAESLGTALAAHLVDRSLIPSAPATHVATLPSAKLRRVLDYVAAHLDTPLTLRTLAGLVDMEQFRFIRAFKQSTGLSPHRYVMEARIDRAKQLLRNPEISITDIALETGFATPSHFSVTFRRIVGQTPRDFREASR